MTSPAELDSETLELLDRLRSFVVEPCRRPMSADGHHAAFNTLIRPLLATASEAYVWPAMSKDRPATYPMDILTAERGRYRFDLSKDVISGYEPFWHASAGSRGSIALCLPRLPDDIVGVLTHCSRLPGCNEPAILSTRYQLSKSDSAGAIRYCDSVIERSEYAFLFSATNGISVMSIFAPRNELIRLYQLAAEHCPGYQR